MDMDTEDIDMSTGGGKESVVKKLDDNTAAALRRGQVVSRISDVVRELVDNAIDAEASSVQVHLIKYGVDKIEVRDNGKGIPSIDVRKAVAGGHTSKLKNVNHLSCTSKQYGFRGEALSSICLSGNVTLITKHVNETKAMRFVLDHQGKVVSENAIARGQGTTVTVEKIFNHLPVRRQRAQEKSTGVAELKQIECYLKSIAIVNPKIHMSLYHDSSLVWTKASVPSVEQALISVLGHNMAKNLVKCGPVDVAVQEEEKRKRTVEAFLPKLPIDVNVVGMSNKRLSMIYVNRRRVSHLSIFEKEVFRYVDAAADNSFSAKKKYPVFVLHITIPSDEADFNLEMDKSKIFMKFLEEVGNTVTDVLKNLYHIQFTNEDVNDDKEQQVGPNEVGELSKSETTERDETAPCKTRSAVTIAQSPVIRDSADAQYRPEKRKANILEFLENVSDSSNNFTQSPSKNEVSGTFTKAASEKFSTLNNSSPQVESTSTVCGVENNRHVSADEAGSLVGNFEIVLEGLEMDSQDEIVDKVQEKQVSMRDWIYGRVLDKQGEVIQNVSVVNRPPPSITPEAGQDRAQQAVSPTESRFANGRGTSQIPRNAFERIGSGLSFHQSVASPSVYKRPRLSEMCHNSLNTQSSQNGVNFSSTPRQITLDTSWKTTPSPSRTTVAPIFQTPTGVRLSQPSRWGSQTRPSNNYSKPSSSLGIPPKSVLEYWKRSGACSEHVDSRIKNVSIAKSNSTDSCVRSQIIGYFGSGYYASRIGNTVGIFSPMQMLRFFPSLKYEYNINLERVSSKESTDSANQAKPALYKMSLDKAEKLFEEFPKRVSPESEIYRKIFYTTVESISKFDGQFSVLR